MRVVVLFGGTSEERDVSTASGAQVVAALRAAGHEVLAVDTARGQLSPSECERRLATGIAPSPPADTHESLARHDAPILARTHDLRSADLIFLARHGGSGEDGTVQALLDLAGMPYTGTGHLGRAYAMDKDVAKGSNCATETASKGRQRAWAAQ